MNRYCRECQAYRHNKKSLSWLQKHLNTVTQRESVYKKKNGKQKVSQVNKMRFLYTSIHLLESTHQLTKPKSG